MKFRYAMHILFVILIFLLCATSAHADPLRETSLNPIDEHSMIIKTQNLRKAITWVAAVKQYKAAIFTAVLEQRRYDEQQQARVAAAVEHYSGTKNLSTPSSGRCGGNLPPCYVMNRESGGSLTAQNPTSTASGKWQFLDSTWNGYGGYSSAAEAPESVQDAKAIEVWAGGAGCSNWSAC